MAKSARPILQLPDLSSLPGKPLSLTTQADDARYAAAEALESDSGLSKRVQDGSVRVLNTETTRTNHVLAEPLALGVRRRGLELSLSTKVPDYVMQQLRMRSAERGITIRNLLLLALRREGLEIEEDDIQDERKRR